MKITPLKTRPLKLKPIRLKPIGKPPLLDTDFDTVPDRYDCNPYNTLQQDNGTYRTTDAQYIPPEQTAFGVPTQEEPFVLSPEEPRQTFRSTLRQKGSEEELMKKAQQAYQQAYGEDVFLFVQDIKGIWRPVKKYTSQQASELGYEINRKGEEILQNPMYTNYHITTDEYFAQRQKIRQQQQKRKTLQRQQTKKNIIQAFKANPTRESIMDREAYAQGPSVSALYKSSSFLRNNPRQPQQIPSRTGGEDYQSSQQPVLDLDLKRLSKPMGYQDRSNFPMHVPYRPTKAAFVKGAPRKPLFKPPLLRRI